MHLIRIRTSVQKNVEKRNIRLLNSEGMICLIDRASILMSYQTCTRPHIHLGFWGVLETGRECITSKQCSSIYI